jgi:hypothetical protein
MHFEDFVRRNGMTVKCLQLNEALDMDWARFEKLVVHCPLLETLVLYECSFERFEHVCELRKSLGKSQLKNLQIVRTPLMTPQLEHLVSILPRLNRLELGNLDWDIDQVKQFLLKQDNLTIFRVLTWRPNGLGAGPMTPTALLNNSRHLRTLNKQLQLEFPSRMLQLDGHFTNTAPFVRGTPQFLLAEYGDLSPLLDIAKVGRS